MDSTRITRRQATQALASGLAVGAVSLPPLNAEDASRGEFRLQYVLASSMYGKTPVAEILPEVAKTSSRVLDIWPMGHANQREQVEAMGHEKFRQLLRRHGVRLGMITRYDLGPYRLQPEMAVLKQYGGRLLVCGGKNTEGKTLRDRVKAFVNNMRQHTDAAARHGITIGIENHGNNLINSPDSLRYLAELGPKNLGIALAPYHLPQDEKLMARLITDLGDKLVHFYAWEHGMGCHKKLPKEQEMMQMPGYGKLDFRPLLEALKKINYQGWTEIFMHPVPRGIPILETTAKVTEAINRSRRYLEQKLASV